MNRVLNGARRFFGTLAIGFAITLGGIALPASAQTRDSVAAPRVSLPGPAATEVPAIVAQALPAAATRRPVRHFEHLIAEPTLQYTISSGTDAINPAGFPLPADILRVTGNLRYRFNEHLGLRYQRVSHTGTAGRTYKSGKANFGGSGYDYEDRESLEWTFDRYLNLNAGYLYRARVCCPGAGDQTNPTPRYYNGPFAELAWRFGPNTIGGRPIRTALRYVQNDHVFLAAAERSLARDQTDNGKGPTYNFVLYSDFFFFHQTKLVPYLGMEYFSTYFNNNPALSITFRKVYGVAYRATRDLTWRFYVKNDQASPVQGDAAHKSTSFVEATYRFAR